jgi:very-short-patch-repair endonuclease
MKEYKLNCCQCQKEYEVKNKRFYRAKYESKKAHINYYCSKECRYLGQNKQEPVSVNCLNCNKEFKKLAKELKKHPNSFCSRSCSATYNNKNKTHGTRRSKLEIYLEEELKSKYNDLDIHFNRKDTINSELDIYIPSMKLAFELNGIFHYEPIYGDKKLNQIQNNDTRKFQACLEKGIEMCIIDVSSLSYFKPANAKKFLDIVCNLIDSKMSQERIELSLQL